MAPCSKFTKTFQFWSSALVQPPQTGVTCNHSLFHWVEQGQTLGDLHVGQSSFLRIGKIGKPLQNYNGGLLTVVTDNLFLVTLSSHIISKLQHFPWTTGWLFWTCLFLTDHSYHWLHCILFIFSYSLFIASSSPTMWFRHFRQEVPAEKMPDPNNRRHSWNQ